VLDALVPDPRRGHPVALFGAGAAALERGVYRDSRTAGAGYAVLCTGAAVAAGRVLRRAGVAGVAAATWVVLGARSLRAEGRAVHAHLLAGDLPAAREQLTHLVGRDTAELPAGEVARAVVESLAENTCDAVVAPLFWGAVAGVPGLLGYRAANTLDAMVGHRSPRYARFGWAAARLDDLANWVPARLSAVSVALAASLAGGCARRSLATALRDGRRHPSPNGGWPEAAFAGALGVRLGGRNSYGERVEHRPVLGDGRPVEVADLPQAVRLCATAAAVSALAAAVLADRGVWWSRREQNPPRS